MPRGVKKENLPSKVCVTCGRPFTWRKKWERCWDEVTTCSKSCNAARRRGETRLLDNDATDATDATDADAAKRLRKEKRRAKREGTADEGEFSKPCTICETPSNTLVRCTVDTTRKWEMVCGKCWKDVSGGVTDGDADHPFYTYGGLWKNRYAKG